MEKNTSKFNENFIKNYDEDSNIGYILEADAEYPKRLQNLHNDLPFLRERMKIKKCHKLVCNWYDKKICHTLKDFKTCIKSWINNKESA